MANIVLNTLTYTGPTQPNGVSTWWNRAVGLVAGFRALTCRVAYNATRTVVAWKLTLPVVKGEDTACGCAGEVVRTAIVDITVRMDPDATTAERLDIKNQISDLVATSEFSGSITSLVQPT